MFESLDPDFVVLVACHSEETAREGRLDGQRWHGVFSYSLRQVLQAQPPDGLRDLHWADIWPALLAAVEESGAKLGNVQHPFSLGRMERRVFGGPWKRQDPGLSLRLNADKVSYAVYAGIVVGVTPGTMLAVYGPDTDFFPDIDSEKDKQERLLTLRVDSADRATCVAGLASAWRALPDGARATIVKPGPGEAVRVRLADPDPQLVAHLKSSILEILPNDATNWDVEVTSQPSGGWLVSDKLTKNLAQVPDGQIAALRAGLQQYYRYALVLRMAHRANDPGLASALQVAMLNAGDQRVVKGGDLANPDLPEVSAERNRYFISSGTRFAIKVINGSKRILHFHVLNCTGDGKVEYLGNETADAGGVRIMWRAGEVGRTFRAGTKRLTGQTDRLIIIATTRPGARLEYLSTDKSVQEVIDEVSSGGRGGAVADDVDAVPSELWTARLIEWYIRP